MVRLAALSLVCCLTITVRVDFHTATAFHTPPSFPQIHLDPDTPPLPDALLEEAACTSPTSLLQLSIAAIDCFNIFYRLHRLSLAASSHWIDRVDRLTLSNLLYETEYTILCVPDYSRHFLDFDPETEDESDEKQGQRKSIAGAASVVEALLPATQIFVYAALREIPLNARIFNILLDRLRIAIERPRISTIESWKRQKNPNLLIWVLVVACSVTPAHEGRVTWISKLSETLKDLNISNRIELEGILKLIAWIDTYSNGDLDDIWKEILHFRSSGSTTERQFIIDSMMPASQIPGTRKDWGYGNSFSAPMDM